MPLKKTFRLVFSLILSFTCYFLQFFMTTDKPARVEDFKHLNHLACIHTHTLFFSVYVIGKVELAAQSPTPLNTLTQIMGSRCFTMVVSGPGKSDICCISPILAHIMGCCYHHNVLFPSNSFPTTQTNYSPNP